MRTIVMCDGGFKAAFVTGIAVKEHTPQNVRLLFMDAGQQAVVQQLAAVERLATHFGIPYTRLNMSYGVAGIFELTTYIFTALSYAHRTGCHCVYYGASKAPKSNPDYELTHTHLRNLQVMVQSAQLERTRIILPEPEAPAMFLNIQQIFKLGTYYSVPFNLTWNCLRAGAEPCGECNRCIEWTVAKRGAKRPCFPKLTMRSN